MVDDAVNGGQGGHRVFEDALPFGKDEVGRDRHAAPFVPFGTKLSILPGCLIVTRNGNWCR
jgi:hypothetical protein